jgi:hypothetical protein
VTEDVAAVEDQTWLVEGPGEESGLARGDGEGAADGAVVVGVAAGEGASCIWRS